MTSTQLFAELLNTSTEAVFTDLLNGTALVSATTNYGITVHDELTARQLREIADMLDGDIAAACQKMADAV